jgi:hypothetical protein
MSDATKNAEREEEEHQTFEGVCKSAVVEVVRARALEDEPADVT